jgi:NAD(P)-dependent dehydrogenase (short-subunit alcohol dehydrogenase family)
MSLIGDTSDAKQVDDMNERIIKRFGEIDVLIDNAGVSYQTNEGFKIPFLEIPEEQWDKVIAVNLKGMFLCTQG